MLEQAIAALPDGFRQVFVLREVEGLTVDETAEALDLLTATVKTRHLRARRRLQQTLAPEMKAALSGAFPFAGADCERMTRRVLDAMAGGGAPLKRPSSQSRRDLQDRACRAVRRAGALPGSQIRPDEPRRINLMIASRMMAPSSE